MTGRAEQITQPVAQHGEGPVWDAERQALKSVDLERGDLVELDASGGVHRTHVADVLTAMRPRRGGGWVLAVERGFRLVGDDLAADGVEIPAFTDRRLRMNDGGCDPQGRFYCGTMAYDERTGAASLHRLDPDGSVSTVLTGVTISNGLQWSADGTTAFYNDTPTKRVTRFDFDADAGELHAGRPFALIGEDDGAPDGMAIDAEDGVWTACWGGWAVRRFDADGALSEVVELPVPNPTACAFGGADGTTLYITTSRKHGGDREAASGALFAVETGVRGGTVHAFAG